MEKKLRKRDRLVFYRNASIVLLFLSFGLGFYLMNTDLIKNKNQLVGKKWENKTKGEQKHSLNIEDKGLSAREGIKEQYTKKSPQNNIDLSSDSHQQKLSNPKLNWNKAIHQSTAQIADQVISNKILNAPFLQNNNVPPAKNGVGDPMSSKAGEKPTIAQVDIVPITIDTLSSNPKKLKIKRKIPISFAISAGPDFNSTSAVLGGKTSVAFGFAVGIGITKKLSVQTGLNYAAKNYSAGAMDYSFNNPNTKNIIADVDAACKVLEIPFRASYNVSENKNRRIEVNAGLSSYVMLNEKYVFNYIPSANRVARTSEIDNQNKHLLSVLDLSATYNIKLKNKKFAFGIEPYVKIPLTGIGEGSVPLKSSGISLKLRYDLNKK